MSTRDNFEFFFFLFTLTNTENKHSRTSQRNVVYFFFKKRDMIGFGKSFVYTDESKLNCKGFLEDTRDVVRKSALRACTDQTFASSRNIFFALLPYLFGSSKHFFYIFTPLTLRVYRKCWQKNNYTRRQGYSLTFKTSTSILYSVYIYTTSKKLLGNHAIISQLTRQLNIWTTSRKQLQ